jgi:hypothetical protein
MVEDGGCAICIDGDGVPFWLMELAIRDVRARHDHVQVRAYKDWTNPGNNRLMVSLWGLGADLVQVNPHAGLSNGTDIAIAVDVVDTHHLAPTRWVALVSNDGDFTSIASYLRRKDVGVVGYGASDASAQLADECDHFVRFDSASRTRTDQASSERGIEDAVAEVVSECAGRDGWTPLDKFGFAVRARYGLSPKDAGARSWSKYFDSCPAYDCAREASGFTKVRIRWRRTGDPQASVGNRAARSAS